MTGYATEVDEMTARAVLALPVDSAQEVPGWAALLREAHSGTDSWDEFVTRVETIAAEAGWAVSAVEAFLRVVGECGGQTLVAGLVELEHVLPEVYESLTGGPFVWVTEEQRAYLAGRWGDAWPDPLTVELDSRWGAGWDGHPGAHKASWLADLIAADAFTDEFAWVPVEHHGALALRWGDDWRGPLSSDLDVRWGGGWQAHPDEHKAAWLTDLLAEPEPATEPATEPPATKLATEPTAMSEDEALDELLAMATALPGFADLTDEEAADVLAEAIEKARS